MQVVERSPANNVREHPALRLPTGTYHRIARQKGGECVGIWRTDAKQSSEKKK